MLSDIKQLSIVGVGLLGGSIGLACKRDFPHIRVVGVGRSEERLKKAFELGVLDRYTLDFGEGVEGSDLVVIATPVSAVVSIYKAILPYLKTSAVVTDVGSTKLAILEEINSLSNEERRFFIGSHPMTGLEASGVEYASPDLYRKAIVLVIKDKLDNQDNLLQIVSFWKTLGSVVQFLTKTEHDNIVALTSHLPHVIASTLSCTLFNILHFDGAIKKGAFGKGLLDTTRIASGEINMWTDILLSNRISILGGLRSFSAVLSLFNSLLEAGDKDEIKIFLAMAREWRRKIPSFLSDLQENK